MGRIILGGIDLGGRQVGKKTSWEEYRLENHVGRDRLGRETCWVGRQVWSEIG